MFRRILILITFTGSAVNAQTVREQYGQMAAYNVVFSGITAGIGSVINRPEGTRPGKAFLRGFTRGAIGGAVMFGGKITARLITEQNSLEYAWLSRTLHATGASMMDNAAAHRGIMERWSMDLYGTRIDISRKGVQVRALPGQLIGAANLWISHDARPMWRETLRGSVFVFESDLHLVNETQWIWGQSSAGAVWVNYRLREWDVLRWWTGFQGHPNSYAKTFSHELIHVMQYREYQVFNTYYLDNRDWKVFRYIYPDLPYHAAFTGAFDGLNNRQSNKGPWHEFEAELFATGRTVNR